MLIEKGHRVSHLSRTKNDGPVKTLVWDVGKHYLEEGALDNIDTIIHLAGAAIADKPWTEKRKQEILESRTKSTALLFDALQKTKHTVQSFISASAMGYYGLNDEDRYLSETEPPGNDFLAQVVTQWEHEVDKVSRLNIRTVKVRISVVLSDKGGALAQMAKPINYYVGVALGSGKQFVSWIHLDDLCSIFIKAAEDPSMEGAYNAVSPQVVTNEELTREIAAALEKPLILPNVPSFVLKLLLGEMADLVLKGSKLSSEKIQESGFVFKFDTLKKALKDLYK